MASLRPLLPAGKGVCLCTSAHAVCGESQRSGRSRRRVPPDEKAILAGGTCVEPTPYPCHRLRSADAAAGAGVLAAIMLAARCCAWR